VHGYSRAHKHAHTNEHPHARMHAYKHRFLVFDKKGKMVAKHQEEKKQIYPQPGW
jgi:hypothetical protein